MPANKLAYPHLCALVAISPTTLSYAMHSAGFNHIKIPFYYSALDTNDTQAAINAMKGIGIRGYSLTIPHKERAISQVDKLTDEALKIGAINTIINDGQSLLGANTDWVGIQEALKEKISDLRNKNALILGAGGAARACIYALRHLGVGNIVVCNRSNARSEEVAKLVAVVGIDFDELKKQTLAEIDLIINATPIGSHLVPSNDFPFSFEQIMEKHIVFDMVTRDTALILEAQRRGAVAIHGLRMLLYQAIAQFELFTGCSAPIKVMENALYEEAQKTGLISFGIKN
ncbi:MAG: shikimate dehydrogenase [Deltaproteobacteria bacterium]|nr:shikimate dehydrogenase [Deltaproteobacteria bacterium]